MTSINGRIGGIRKEVDYQKLGPALLIASSLVLAINPRPLPCRPLPNLPRQAPSNIHNSSALSPSARALARRTIAALYLTISSGLYR